MSQRLGDLLVKEKVITQEQLEQALKSQKETGTRAVTIIAAMPRRTQTSCRLRNQVESAYFGDFSAITAVAE